MNFLVVLLAAVCYVAAEPALWRYDYPQVYKNFAHSPIQYPLVNNIIPNVVNPVHYPVPYYEGLKSQYYDRDLIGRARYGHIEPGQSHHAVQDAYGNKMGSFSFYDAEGKLMTTKYVADGAGYRVLSSDLPLSTPSSIVPQVPHLSDHAKINLFRAKRDVLFTPASTTSIDSPLTSHVDYRIGSPFTYGLPLTNTLPIVKPHGLLGESSLFTGIKTGGFPSPILPTVDPISPLSKVNYRFFTPNTLIGNPLLTRSGFLADTL